jgi:hypothetical protein
LLFRRKENHKIEGSKGEIEVDKEPDKIIKKDIPWRTRNGRKSRGPIPMED